MSADDEPAVRKARDELGEHMKRFPGELTKAGTFASEEFDRLYLAWIRLRWDAGHAWTRSIWKERP